MKTINFCGLKLKYSASKINNKKGIKEDCYFIDKINNMDIILYNITLYVRTTEEYFSVNAYILGNQIQISGKYIKDIEKKFKVILNKIVKNKQKEIKILEKSFEL